MSSANNIQSILSGDWQDIIILKTNLLIIIGNLEKMDCIWKRITSKNQTEAIAEWRKCVAAILTSYRKYINELDNHLNQFQNDKKYVNQLLDEDILKDFNQNYNESIFEKALDLNKVQKHKLIIRKILDFIGTKI